MQIKLRKSDLKRAIDICFHGTGRLKHAVKKHFHDRDVPRRVNDKYHYVKNWLNRIIDTRFGGNTENALIAFVGGLGVIFALSLVFLGNSNTKDEHGHGGDEHGEHEEGSRSIELSDDAIASSEIKLETVAKTTINRVVKLRGRITVNRDKFVKIGPRYSGTVQSVRKALGDQVSRGEVLARIESAAARAVLDVRSGISGVVVERNVVRGVFVSDREPMFTVVDLSTVWAEFNVYDTDFPDVKSGLKIRIMDAETGKSAESTVSYVSPNVHEDTQSLIVRAIIDNADSSWRPGSFIEAEISTGIQEVSAAVRLEAMQTLDNKPAIFVKSGDDFEARDVVLGTSDSQFVEVISGVREGESYISANSFIAKAELMKSTAAHEH